MGWRGANMYIVLHQKPPRDRKPQLDTLVHLENKNCAFSHVLALLFFLNKFH